jgi:hypothetical protein
VLLPGMSEVLRRPLRRAVRGRRPLLLPTVPPEMVLLLGAAAARLPFNRFQVALRCLKVGFSPLLVLTSTTELVEVAMEVGVDVEAVEKPLAGAILPRLPMLALVRG